MSLTRSAVLCSIAGLLSAVVTAGPATADRYIETDPAGDMWARHYSGPDSSYQYATAPEHENLDIRRVVVRHAPRVVFIRVAMRELTRLRDGQSFGLNGFIKVNRAARPLYSPGAAWQLMLWFPPDDRPRFYIQDSANFEVPGCSFESGPKLKALPDYDRDRLTLIIPRSCLNEAGVPGPEILPRWVKVSLSTWHGTGNDEVAYLDRLGTSAREEARIDNSHFTPRVYPRRLPRLNYPRTCG